jgi:hypothetical protein
MGDLQAEFPINALADESELELDDLATSIAQRLMDGTQSNRSFPYSFPCQRTHAMLIAITAISSKRNIEIRTVVMRLDVQR